METLKFKTNIMCGSCINTVTPALNNISAIKTWKVDTASPSKILSIETDDAQITEQILNSLKHVGYKAEQL